MRPLIALLVLDEKNRKLVFRLAFLLYLAVLVLGSIPGARHEIGAFGSGLVLHLLTYSFIALLLFCGAEGNARRKAFKSFGIVMAMGAVDEFVQSFFPYRTASIYDWLIDVNAGLLTCALLCAVWPASTRENAKQP